MSILTFWPMTSFARIAEQPFGGRVHRLDDALFVDGDDRVDCGIEDCAGSCFAFDECLIWRPCNDF